MPFTATNKIRTYYRLEGRTGLPVLVLSQSLGCDHGMWDPQMPGLLPYFQVLRYDTRGHGGSDAPQGDYSMDQLGSDVLGLVDALGISKMATNEELSLYPNPSTGTLKIKSNLQFTSVRIYNATGAVVSSSAVTGNTININFIIYCDQIKWL